MYVLVQGLAQYKYNPYNAAIFDVALYSNSTVLQDLIPVPGGSKQFYSKSTLTQIGGAVDISGTQTDATVSWTGTGNGNDTYSVYKFYGNMPLSTSGFINYTACGAATFMKNLGTVEADASGAATYKETNLAGAKTSFTIVANRIGGYSTAYGPISVGGISHLFRIFVNLNRRKYVISSYCLYPSLYNNCIQSIKNIHFQIYIIGFFIYTNVIMYSGYD